MGNNAQHTINFSSIGIPDDSVWVKMEQEVLSETAQDANLFDIFQMMGRASSGLTAASYVPTGFDYAYFTATSIVVRLNFWLFPSDLALNYALTIKGGSVSDRIYEEVPKTGNIVIPLVDKLQMPYLVEPGSSSFAWETPVYDKTGNLLNRPPIQAQGSYLTFDQDVFGIIRANLKAKGYKYTAHLTFPKSKAGRAEISEIVNNQVSYNAITNVNCSVICTYNNENGEAQEEILELKIPKIVEAFLAECPSGSRRTDPRCEPTIGDEIDKRYTTTLYYSTCTGEILDTVRSDTDSTGCDNE